jgi:hypothetical protein
VKIPKGQVQSFWEYWREFPKALAFNLYARFKMWQWSRQTKFIWKCSRTGGGGTLNTPRRMTRAKAEMWLIKRVPDSSICYVDPDYHFIFYETRGL